MNRMLNIFKEKSAKQKESVRTAQPRIIARLIEGSRRELRRWLSMVRARLTSATKFWQMIKGTSRASRVETQISGLETKSLVGVFKGARGPVLDVL